MELAPGISTQWKRWQTVVRESRMLAVELFATSPDAADKLLTLEEAYHKALVEYEEASDSYQALLTEQPDRPDLVALYQEVTAKGDRARGAYADFEGLRRTLVAA